MSDHEIVPVLPAVVGDWPTCAACGRHIQFGADVGWVHRSVKP